MAELAGRVAVVTGAAQGLGRAIASRLAADGAAVMLADVQGDKVAATASGLAAGGLPVRSHTVDVASSASVGEMVSAAVRAFGRIDMLVNVAGGSGRVPVNTIEDMSDEVWDSVIASNLRGSFLCCRAALPHLRRSGDGRILNLSSGAVKGMRGRSTVSAPLAYAAAKAGIHGLTNQLAADLDGTNVAVNVLQPGFVLTEPGARVRELFDGLTEADRAQMLAMLKVPPRLPEAVGWGVSYLMGPRTRGVTGTALRLTGNITNGNLRIVSEGTSALGSFARVEPAEQP